MSWFPFADDFSWLDKAMAKALQPPSIAQRDSGK
jgi:hypothetical protein